MAEKVAQHAHRRGCGSFDGVRAVPAERFDGSHKAHDVVWASIHIADLCTALGITPGQIETLAAADPSTLETTP
jgi:hypothetical protein